MEQYSMLWRLLSLLSMCYGDIYVGRALNVFNYFGDLGAVLKVNPSSSINWFSDRSSVDIFEEVLECRSPLISSNETVFDGEFNLELCDDSAQLEAALFKKYKIERCDRTWRAFTGGWNRAASARHLGINSSFLTGSHGYILVRLTRSHELVKLISPESGLKMNNWTAERTDKVKTGDIGSVMDCLRSSGSHYVDSYTTGDSLFQVFVFTPAVYEKIQSTMRDYKKSIQGLDAILHFFTPWYAEHIGNIVSTSGITSLERWAEENLQSKMFMFMYPNLLILHSHPELLQDLRLLLGNRGLLSAELKTLAELFEDNDKKQWFEEVLDNHLKLWDLSV